MAENENAANEQDFEIKSELEFLLQAGREGKISLATLFQALLRSHVYMVLDSQVNEGDNLGSVQSLMVENDQGEQLLTIFTGRERCESFVGKHPGYDHPTQFPAPLLIDNMRDDMGLVINPGLAVGIQITAEGMRGLRRDFGPPVLKNIPAPMEGGQGGNA
ncbi:SseB family protein [Natronospira bacteriovora]|uniref:SseB family protein n=1 Tax=Natronospira bacteriovora TaxID=3069753 RepID=A0ABU0W456_9GAMM|nr:SseB family protein [Natronospira sp. AB-CW4]MDQ2068744.1 SseB family protein [Natronospira sp. AB-CW4]